MCVRRGQKRALGSLDAGVPVGCRPCDVSAGIEFVSSSRVVGSLD